MTIQVHGYTEQGSIDATIDGFRMFVPDGDTSNRHRQMIAEWEAKGNTIKPYVEPVVDISKADQEQVNAALTTEGSVVRALCLVVFDISTGKIPIKPSYTMAQYLALLKAKMR